MMKWQMEILSPASYVPSANWLVGDDRNVKWTVAENKLFENALAVYDEDTPDRWHRVAATIPGKTVADVINHYKELEIDVSNIEAGLVPVPGYDATSPFTLEWVNTQGYDGFKQSYGLCGKRSSSGRPAEQERKKGVPWTEEEHKLFLLGLKKYGKGDWRNISRNFVITRTPTQVASHAQKYFIRQLSGGKDKRRASIHDITTVNLHDTKIPSTEDNKALVSQPCVVFPHQQQRLSSATQRAHSQWNQTIVGVTKALNSTQEKLFMSTYGANSCELKMQKQELHEDAGDESHIGSQSKSGLPHAF